MRTSLLLLLLTVVPAVRAAENQVDTPAGSPTPSSYLTYVTSCLTNRWFGVAALVGIGAYAVYVWAKNAIQQEEERVFEEYEQVPESFVVSKKDGAMILALVQAMEEDVAQYGDQPERVHALEFVDFDDIETVNACEGVRSSFCMVYEQSIQHPENKPILEEFVMIFRQAIEETMVVA